MSASMTVAVPVPWIVGEPTIHNAKDSVQGYADLFETGERDHVHRYNGDFEILQRWNAERGGYRFHVVWYHTDYETDNLEDAEFWLAEQVVRDGAITGLTL